MFVKKDDTLYRIDKMYIQDGNIYIDSGIISLEVAHYNDNDMAIEQFNKMIEEMGKKGTGVILNIL